MFEKWLFLLFLSRFSLFTTKGKTKQQENKVMSLLRREVMKSPPPSKGDHSLPALAVTAVFKIEMNPKM